MFNSQLSRKQVSMQRQPYYSENLSDNKDNAQWPADLECKLAGPMSDNVFWRTSKQLENNAVSDEAEAATEQYLGRTRDTVM